MTNAGSLVCLGGDDLALHRLYTYVLKKLLGPFLEDELVLGQLEVSLLVGRIELSCLRLNASLLTSYAPALGLGAFEVLSASVSRLSVYIPYSKLLEEEIVFTLEGVKLDLIPRTSSFPSSPSAKLNASALSGSIFDGNAVKGGYAKDMDFVAAWVEQMVSTVRVEVKDTTINMNRGESSGGGIMLCMKLPSCTFRDETMEHEYSSPPSVYKRISIAPLSISLATEGGPVVEICRTEGLCTVRLRFCQDVTPLMEVNVGLCQVNFELYPEAIMDVMVLFSTACRRHVPLDSSSYEDPMRWVYLFGDPFWRSAASFTDFSEEGTRSSNEEDEIDVVTLDKILEMYATARAKLEEEAIESMCESVYYDAKDHHASDEQYQRHFLVRGTELRVDGKFAGFKVNLAPSQQGSFSTGFVIDGTHASISWLLKCQDEKPTAVFEMMSISLKEKHGEESFTTLFDFIHSENDGRHSSSFSPVVQLMSFTDNTVELMFRPLFISVNVPAYVKFVHMLSAGFINVATATEPEPESEPCDGTTMENVYNHPGQEVEILALAPMAQQLVETSRSPKSACWHHHIIMKFPYVLLGFSHCNGYDGDGSDCNSPRWKTNERNESIDAELQAVTSDIYIGNRASSSPSSSARTTPILTVHCDRISASVTVEGHKMEFIHLEGTSPGLMTVSKFKPCEFVVSHCFPEISEIEETEAVPGTATIVRAWDPVDEGIFHPPSPGKGGGKAHTHSLIQFSIKAASAAIGISVRGIDILKRLFADNARDNDYCAEHTNVETVLYKGGVPFVFSVDNAAFVLTDDGPEDPDLFAGKAYCATTLSGLSGIFSRRDGSLQVSAADVTFMEGDSLQRTRSCSLMKDAVDLAQQGLECALAPVLLHRTPYVVLAKGSNVLDVKLEFGTERGSTLNINLTCITMRHTLPLHWPTRLKYLIVALTSQLCAGASRPSTEAPSSPYATTVFVTIHNGVVDYIGDGMRDLGHALASVGQLRLSATVVAHAPAHVAKLIARDVSLYIRNSCSSSHLGGGDGVNTNYGLKHPKQMEASSVRDALEHCGFVQIATLDFADVVVTVKGVSAVAELWMGTLHAYTCSDSLATILGLLSHWWLCLQDQIQKQVLAKATKEESNKSSALGNNNSLLPPVESHLLQDIDVHAFSPRNILKYNIHDKIHEQQPTTTMTNPQEGVLDGNVEQEHSVHVPLSSSVVIEDFYCLNKVTDAEDTTALEQREDSTDGIMNDKESLEQPQARWLPPSIEDSYHGEHDSASSSSLSSQISGEISMLGSTFNLPCDIDIELEEREGSPLIPLEGEQVPLPPIIPSRLTSPSQVDSEEEDSISGINSLMEQQLQEECCPSSPLHHPVAQWFTPSSDMRIYPHHVPIPQSTQEGQPSAGPVEAGDGVALAIILHDLNVCFRMFKGCDWPALDKTSGASLARKPPNSMDDNLSSFGGGTEGAEVSQAALLDALIDNYQEAPPLNRRSSSSSSKNTTTGGSNYKQRRNGDNVTRKSGRITMSMVQVLLQNVSMRLDSYQQLEENSSGEALLSHLALAIRDVHVSDTLASHRLRRILGHWCDGSEHPRESHESMLTLQITTRTPSQRFLQCGKQLGDELRVRIRLLPLHLSFAQPMIDFLRDFFNASTEKEGDNNIEMGLGTSVDPACISFFQSFDVGACKLLIDYIPRTIHIDELKSGSYLELLNLFPLEGVSLTVERVLLSGVSGASTALSEALKSWVRDVTKKQMHQFLAGASIIRPLVHVGQGMMDLVLIPLQHYRKDKKILRGLTAGAASFCRIVIDEALHTSHRLTGAVARTLDGIVPGKSVDKRRPLYLYQVDQPKGVRDGFEYAFESLQDAAKGVVTVAIPYEEHERDDAGGYVRTVIRVLPVAVLRPVVGATEAVSLILLGFRNAANPRRRRDEEAMWSFPE